MRVHIGLVLILAWRQAGEIFLNQDAEMTAGKQHPAPDETVLACQCNFGLCQSQANRIVKYAELQGFGLFLLSGHLITNQVSRRRPQA